jgi:hypothetical protein
MSRTIKPGLNYFPFDVDFFNDDKVELISSEFGSKGEVIAIRLLCLIYRNGYFYKWGKDESLLFAKRVGNGVTSALVDEVVNGLVKRSFFDKGVFDRFEILTSKGIQRRYIEAKERAKNIEIIKEYTLIHENVTLKHNNVTFISIKGDIGTQRKRKESKEEESNGETPLPTLKELEWKEVLEWIKDKAPRIMQMKEPLTIEQYFTLKEKYEVDAIPKILQAMHNWKPLTTKNISAYLTFLTFIKREIKAA